MAVEYKHVSYAGEAGDPKAVEAELNKLGKEGWSAFFVNFRQNIPAWDIMLQRTVPDAADQEAPKEAKVGKKTVAGAPAKPVS